MKLHAGLHELYSSNWNDFKAAIDHTKHEKPLNGPYLCSPSDDYWESAVKLVFVGQETNGWNSQPDVEKQMEIYSKFGVAKNYKKGAFWQVIRKIEKNINGKEYGCASLNLNKFDVNRKGPGKSYSALMEKFDHILLAEIQLLKPDAVIFFTGPSYDRRLINLFNAEFIKLEDFEIRQLAEIKSPNIPYIAIRTIHPQSMRRLGREKDFLTQMTKILNRDQILV